MQNGSLINHLMDKAPAAGRAPVVGEGATIVSWSDRHAGTIVEVSPTGHRVVWQRDKATRTDGNGMSDTQTYEYERDPHAPKLVFTRRKDGAYRLMGGQSRLLIGQRDSYFDFSF